VLSPEDQQASMILLSFSERKKSNSFFNFEKKIQNTFPVALK